jgi:hypothetical protein
MDLFHQEDFCKGTIQDRGNRIVEKVRVEELSLVPEALLHKTITHAHGQCAFNLAQNLVDGCTRAESSFPLPSDISILQLRGRICIANTIVKLISQLI